MVLHSISNIFFKSFQVLLMKMLLILSINLKILKSKIREIGNILESVAC